MKTDVLVLESSFGLCSGPGPGTGPGPGPRKRVREDGEVRYRKQSWMKRFQRCRQYQESLRM